MNKSKKSIVSEDSNIVKNARATLMEKIKRDAINDVCASFGILAAAFLLYLLFFRYAVLYKLENILIGGSCLSLSSRSDTPFFVDLFCGISSSIFPSVQKYLVPAAIAGIIIISFGALYSAVWYYTFAATDGAVILPDLGPVDGSFTDRVQILIDKETKKKS